MRIAWHAAAGAALLISSCATEDGLDPSAGAAASDPRSAPAPRAAQALQPDAGSGRQVLLRDLDAGTPRVAIRFSGTGCPEGDFEAVLDRDGVVRGTFTRFDVSTRGAQVRAFKDCTLVITSADPSWTYAIGQVRLQAGVYLQEEATGLISVTHSVPGDAGAPRTLRWEHTGPVDDLLVLEDVAPERLQFAPCEGGRLGMSLRVGVLNSDDGDLGRIVLSNNDSNRFGWLRFKLVARPCPARDAPP